MHWLRIWIPSWRLFDQEGFVPRLYVKPHNQNEWQLVLKNPVLKWRHLFLNPDGGYHHAACNAVEALVQNPKDPHAHRIVAGLCRRFLQEGQKSGNLSFQFKITAEDDDLLYGEE